jgi:hypothetical protein
MPTLPPTFRKILKIAEPPAASFGTSAANCQGGEGHDCQGLTECADKVGDFKLIARGIETHRRIHEAAHREHQTSEGHEQTYSSTNNLIRQYRESTKAT